MKLLSKESSSVLAICGAGAQGRTQLEAAMMVRPGIKKVYVYDIRPESSARFVEESKAKYPDVEFIAAATPKEAVSESDIIVCVTLANEPFIEADWLKKGALVMNMADFEVTYDCVKKASKDRRRQLGDHQAPHDQHRSLSCGRMASSRMRTSTLSSADPDWRKRRAARTMTRSSTSTPSAPVSLTWLSPRAATARLSSSARAPSLLTGKNNPEPFRYHTLSS